MRRASPASIQAVALGLLICVPAVPADLVLDADGPSQPVMPEAEAVPIDLSIAVPCLGTSIGAASTGHHHLVVGLADGIAGVILAGPTEFDVNATACPPVPGAATTYIVPYQLFLSRDLPGLEPVSFAIEARLAAGDPEEDQSGRVELSATPGYLPLIEVVVGAKLQQVGRGQTSTVVLQVRNLGNAPTTIATELIANDTLPAEAIRLPADLTLDSPTAGAGADTAGDVAATFTAPDGAFGRGGYTLRLTPRSTQQPELVGQAVEVNVAFQDADDDPFVDATDIPAAPAPWLAVALVGLAFLAARRRA